jgi:hypothetical protein
MIGLRRTIDRALGHRWLGPVILIVLVVLLVFVMLHTTLDAAHHELALACLAIVVAALGLLVRPRRQIDRTRPPREIGLRGPPRLPLTFALSAVPQPTPPPLRL